MATAKFIRTETLDTKGGQQVDLYLAENAISVRDALDATGLPALGSGLPGNPLWSVQGYGVECLGDIDLAHPTAPIQTWNYLIRVNYETFHGTLGPPEPPPVAVYHWSMGVMSQHINIDLDGNSLGQKIMRDPGGVGIPDPDNPKRLWENPQGDLGTDVFVPTLELEIEMPAGTNWVPDYVASLLGYCNQDTMYFRGCPAVNQGYVLFAGANCEQTALGNNKINYRFTLGRMPKPAGPTGFIKWKNNGVNYPWADIPMAYGLEAQPYARLQNGIWEIQPKPLNCYVFRAYPLAPLMPLLANASPGRQIGDL